MYQFLDFLTVIGFAALIVCICFAVIDHWFDKELEFEKKLIELDEKGYVETEDNRSVSSLLRKIVPSNSNQKGTK